MPYTPLVWVESVTDVGPTNLNHLETGLSNATTTADAAIPAPIGPAANAGLVYNGSSWVAAKLVDANVSSSAAIAYSKLALAGSIVNNDVSASAAIAKSKLASLAIADADVAAGAAVIASKLQWSAGTSPPGSPTTGDLWFYQDVANSIYWLFRYNSAQATYKWEFVGGSPLVSFVATDETTTSATYTALATAGPSIALPRAGDYDILIESYQQQDGGTGKSYMSYDIGGTGAVDGDGAFMNNPGVATTMGFTASRRARKTGLTAVTLTAKYRSASTGQMHAANRAMTVTPVRVI